MTEPIGVNRSWGAIGAVLLCGLQDRSQGSRHAPRQYGHQAECHGACVFGAPADGPSRLGAIAGDLCGFPNGRRLLDDVVDIEIRAVVEGYGPTLNAVLGVPNRTPNNLLGDGVDSNDRPFLSAFPYVTTAFDGYSHSHHPAGPTPS